MFVLACTWQTEEYFKKERRKQRGKMNEGWGGGGAEARAQAHRLICPCLTSPSVVLWPGTLTPTTTRQGAVTSFLFTVVLLLPQDQVLSVVGLLMAFYSKEYYTLV